MWVRVTFSAPLTAHGADDVCHLATIGRRSGRWRLVELWFATDGTRVYALAGGRDRAHWVRNLTADPRVRLRLGGQGGRTIDGVARVVSDAAEDARARQLVAAKYQGWAPGDDLSPWAATSLPVAVEAAQAESIEPAAGIAPTRPGGQ